MQVLKRGDVGTANRCHTRFMQINAEVMKDSASCLTDLCQAGLCEPRGSSRTKQNKTNFNMCCWLLFSTHQKRCCPRIQSTGFCWSPIMCDAMFMVDDCKRVLSEAYEALRLHKCPDAPVQPQFNSSCRPSRRALF